MSFEDRARSQLKYGIRVRFWLLGFCVSDFGSQAFAILFETDTRQNTPSNNQTERFLYTLGRHGAFYNINSAFVEMRVDHIEHSYPALDDELNTNMSPGREGGRKTFEVRVISPEMRRRISDLREFDCAIPGHENIAPQKENDVVMEAKSGHDISMELKRSIEELAERVSQQNAQTTRMVSVLHAAIRNLMDVAYQQHTQTTQIVTALRSDIQELKDVAFQKEKYDIEEVKSGHDELTKNVEELDERVAKGLTTVASFHMDLERNVEEMDERVCKGLTTVAAHHADLEKNVEELDERVSQQLADIRIIQSEFQGVAHDDLAQVQSDICSLFDLIDNWR